MTTFQSDWSPEETVDENRGLAKLINKFPVYGHTDDPSSNMQHSRLEAFRFASYQDLDQNFDTVVEVLNVTSPYPLK